MSGPKDIIGNEIKTGSWVAFCLAGTSMRMYTSRVLRVTASRVVLDEKSYESGPNLQRPFDAVVVIPDPATGGEVAV